MNLRTRFALLFSLFVFIILMISLSSIYFLYEKFRSEEFYQRVHEKAVLFGAYYATAGGGGATTGDIPKPTLTLSQEKIAVYANDGRLIASYPDTASHPSPAALLPAARQKGVVYHTMGNMETVLLYRNQNGTTLYIQASAYDLFGRRKIENLQWILMATLGGGLLLSGLFAFFYVQQITRPLGQLTRQMQNITERNMDERVMIGHNNNELTRIARNFNEMLDRLENAFEMRKRFVQHASHELRTPLTNMLAQTEAALNKQLTQQEAHAILTSLREDQQHLIELTNSLLLLSRYEKLPNLTDLSLVRVDETLYEAIDKVKVAYPACHITVNYTSLPENENLLSVLGNEVLLMSALQNLLKNACHYSEDNDVNINIDPRPGGMTITFDNKGQQLSHEEQQRLFIPFFRGENSTHKKGFGLGLSIVQRIINLHKGSIAYTALQGQLNRFTVQLPKVGA